MSKFSALRCDFCNGGLVIDDSREFAVCEFCGTKYLASTLRAKVQEIRGTVKIDGDVTVKQSDFTIRGGVLERYNGSSMDVVIPDNVSIIGKMAFKDCRGIKRVAIPKSVIDFEPNDWRKNNDEDIGAFNCCSNLEEVKIAGNINIIPDHTFYNCESLKNISFSNRGTVKVEGAVETTIGSSEKDRLLKNANAFYRIGEIEKALKEYGAIQDKFPECVDAWKNSLEIIVNEGLCATGPSNYAETIVKEIIRHCRVLERLMGERFSIKYYRDIFFNNICKGKIFILFQTGMVNPFDVLKPFLLKEQVEFITKQSKENAKKVNDLNILWKISGVLYYNYCISYIGVILYVKKCRPYDISTYDWIKAKVASNSQELEKCINTIQAERRDKGVCQNCGNSFKGRLHKVCSHCNKPKNY